jgi:lactoylglutathione lyase
MEGMMFTKVDYVMVTVSDMHKSIEFYRDKLGLPLKMETPGWSEFQTGPTTLALHGGSRPKAASTDAGQAGKPGADRGHGELYAGTCTMGFSVDDVQKTFEELKSAGVSFVMPPTLREGEGIKLAVCVDPDGLAISFAEPVHRAAGANE